MGREVRAWGARAAYFAMTGLPVGLEVFAEGDEQHHDDGDHVPDHKGEEQRPHAGFDPPQEMKLAQRQVVRLVQQTRQPGRGMRAPGWHTDARGRTQAHTANV